jgi:putative flippase GtrA
MKWILRKVSIDARLLRYVGAGGLAFVVDYATLLGLTELLDVHYLISATGGFLLGSVVCYALSVLWVFDEHRYQSRSTELMLFVAIGICGLCLNNLLIWAGTEGVGLPYQFSKLLAAGGVLFFNYTTRRVVLFSAQSTHAA